ncbi:MAG: hypothetical protein IPP73_11200 [Chitinophagaceae bacterium]|nr:hypothetical protein [Chitinophagaceae bacterium]
MRFLPVATRHFQAPRTTQIMAELHDMFEGIGKGKTKQQDKDYDSITLFNGKEEKDFSNYQNPNGNMDEPQSFEEARRFVYPDVKNLPLTYLADPMAAGVVFFWIINQTPPRLENGEAKYCSFYSDEAITKIPRGYQ